MFHYFGYGSNLSLASLRAKGVSPLAAEPAVLPDWRLTFNIPDFFRIEGGTGNIEPAIGDEVHGVVYAFRDRDLRTLDELEALGVSYRRRELVVRTYRGEEVTANVYVGIPTRLAAGYRPSGRYLTILVRGAEEMKLRPAYIDRLRAYATWTAPEYGPFTIPSVPDRVLTLDELAATPLHTGLGGAVFDMRGARAEHEYLQGLFERRDVTVFFLKRMHESDGSETLEDFIEGRLTSAQQHYLANYLHEFSREYRYAGRLRYDSRKQRRTPRRTPSWRIGDVRVPSREILESAERTNRVFGHENLGFLSEEHGFMPAEEPKAKLPSTFRALDEVVAELPRLHASLELRRRIEELPLLSADEDRLPDAYLLRAGAVLSMLAHAYHYVETAPPPYLPPTIAEPWRQVRERLGREQEVLSYIDLIVYNWRVVDAAAPDPLRVENMRLLIPTVDTDEERRFYLTQTEILARCAPIVGQVVAAQESVARNDPDGVADALTRIIEALERVVRDSLLKINPNPSGPTYVDPVVWAKTVAPFAVPMKAGLQGPSGTSSPIFNLLDSFFARKRNESFLGKEIRQLRAGYPRFWREFLNAVEAISVPDFVRRVDRPSLSGLFKEAMNVYAGQNGFLGRHRTKVYGYLELGFKVGRSVTIGGFAGMFRDRTWDEVDTELEIARGERLESFPSSCHYATVSAVTAPAAQTPGGVRHVVLDVAGSGVRYEPGDRCGILPENEPRLVDVTLAALHATGDEPIELTDEWRSAVALRPGLEPSATLPLRDLLRYARIRPVVPRVAEALHASSQNPILRRALQDQNTTRWELWDLLQRLERDGFDPTILWTSELAAAHHICRVVPPETFRMYSIASAMRDDEGGEARELHLMVGRIAYSSETASESPLVERRGTASNFLADAVPKEQRIAFFVEHPPRFGLPEDPSTPIVMFAGGTGLSPFRGFLQARARQPNAGPALLFFAARSREFLYFRDELRDLVAEGQLELHVAFSREDSEVVIEDGTLRYRPGQRRYIQDLIADEPIARRLLELVRSRSEGGEGAHVYVCGRGRFARSVHEALKGILSREGDGPREGGARRAEETLRRLSGEGRYAQEIFTDARSTDEDPPAYPVSEIALRNDDSGYWVVIDHRVYDVTEFVHLHPGGRKILAGYAGMDASQGYLRAHAKQSEVRAMLEMYEIGVVARPDFGDAHGTMPQADGGERVVALSAFYDLWVDGLHLIVEMQNALRNDHSLQEAETARRDPIQPRSLYKLQRSIETHERFAQSYLDGFFGEPVTALWRYTRGLCHPSAPATWFKESLEEIYDGYPALFVEHLAGELHRTLDAVRKRGGAADDPDRLRLVRACELLEREDRRFLAELKTVLREGVRIFESHGAATLESGGRDLFAAVSQLQEVLAHYFERVFDALAEDGWRIVLSVDGRRRVPIDEQQHLETLVSTPYWSMEQDRDKRIVLLTRNAVPVEDIDALLEQNELLIEHMVESHAEFGIVVDMRQAPQRNDGEFEGAMRRLRREISNRYGRVAVLLMSAMGVLQVKRITRSDEAINHLPTQSKQAAIKFAMGKRRGSDR